MFSTNSQCHCLKWCRCWGIRHIFEKIDNFDSVKLIFLFYFLILTLIDPKLSDPKLKFIFEIVSLMRLIDFPFSACTRLFLIL